jgi:hypothetical protein
MPNILRNSLTRSKIKTEKIKGKIKTQVHLTKSRRLRDEDFKKTAVFFKTRDNASKI